MRFRTWPLAAVGLAGLLLLVVIFGHRRRRGGRRKSTRSSISSTRIIARSRRSFAQLRGDVHLSGIYVRDYLLDNARERAPEYRQRLSSLRETNRATLAELLAIARAARRRRQPHPESRSESARLLGGVRAALRLDHRRENQSQRQLPAPRGAAAPRSRARDRPGNRRAQRREPSRAASRGHAAAGGVRQRAVHPAVAKPPVRVVAGDSRGRASAHPRKAIG